MMLADSIEAASRSLKNPSVDDIDNLVEKLANAKIKMVANWTVCPDLWRCSEMQRSV
ncbi:MAG: hypothetical protein R2788_03710 [Saprospiraceae bacterium]